MTACSSVIGRKIAHEHRSVVSLMPQDCEMIIGGSNRLHGCNGIEVSRVKLACFAEASAIQAATTICRVGHCAIRGYVLSNRVVYHQTPLRD